MVQNTALVQRKATPAERFSKEIQRQFSSQFGDTAFTPYQKTLGQHLFIKIDMAMIEVNAKRKDDQPEISWQNINMMRLATDAVNRVQLGVDALIPGHLYPIFYYNKAAKNYTVDLRVGYKGELYYKQQAAMKPIRKIRVEPVYATDEFVVYKRGLSQEVEGYDFKVTQPFDRGELVGGFGYIEYEDDQDNDLVILSKAEIEKYRAKSMGIAFWGPWYEQMAYKTIVRRTTDKIILDPQKINVTALAAVEADEQRELLPEAEPQSIGEPIYLEPEDEQEPPRQGPPQSVSSDEEPF